MTTGYPKNPTAYFVPLLSLITFVVLGCGSSRVVVEEDEWADRWTEERVETPESRLAQLQRDNEALRQEIARQTQENRSLNARIAELEKRLMEERERLRALEEARAREAEPVRPATTITRTEFDREYTRALNLFMDRRYQEAKDLFTQLLNSGIDHPLLPNCQYWIGESLFGMREYRRAIEAFQRVFEYRSQIKHDDAQIMIANSYFMLGDRQRARQEYQRLIDRYPNSDYVAFARQRLREI